MVSFSSTLSRSGLWTDHQFACRDCYGVSDVGRKRNRNEDQFLITDLSNGSSASNRTSHLFDGPHAVQSRGMIFAVADGVGGFEGGDVASTIVVQRLGGIVQDLLLEDSIAARSFGQIVPQCQAELHKVAEMSPRLKLMSTTLTMAYVFGNQGTILHVGDSRCYHMRDGQLLRVTNDHTLAQQMADSGILDPEMVAHSPWKKVLSNYLAASRNDSAPDIHEIELQSGDALLLCTDGLTNHVSDERIADVIESGQEAELVCQQLIHDANEAGGSDNITVVAARF